jgi:hypothetical protein
MYERVADLPLTIESVFLGLGERATSAGFTRATTTVVLRGGGCVGRGEDVAYEREAHHAVKGSAPDLAAEYTLASVSAHLDDVDLWPTPPGRAADRHYRRWGFESAALDLALRQADTDLGAALGREYDPVRFVVSTRLEPIEDEGRDAHNGDGPVPATDPVDRWLDVDPALAFKLDPTPAWDDATVEGLAATGAVRTLDLKGVYDDEAVATPPDPALYRRVLDGFPAAIVEDPRLAEDTRPIVEDHRERISWDFPITGVDSVEALPFAPRWLNCKPSRFGTVASLLEFLEYCEAEGIRLYGGGQFELGVGRDQIQALASLCYPDGPNDVAPRGYNDPEPGAGLATSPLAPPPEPVGFGGSWSATPE